MKKSVIFYSLSLVILAVILQSCKKHEVPTLTTSEITNITGTTATSGGSITDEGSGTIVERGICWSKGITPTVADNRTIEGGGAGTYVNNMTDLDAATIYYVRAYATNEAGTGYGMALSFATLGEAPSATTQAATDITTTSATLHGVVNSNYLSTTVTFEYGTTESYGQTLTAIQSPVTGNSNANVTADLTGLAEGTTYHFRVKTVNSLGTTNGDDLFFTTLGQAPTAVTQAACCLSSTGAKLNGTVNANYVSATVTFEYGLTTAYGSTVEATPSPVTGNNATSVSTVISGLNPWTTYHFRVKAENSLGVTYGSDLTFTTLGQVPILTTIVPSTITGKSALSGGVILSDGGGSVTARGVCWGTSENPTISGSHTMDGNNTGIFMSRIGCLTEGTTYYVSAYATNSAGTGYGDQLSFTTAQINNPIIFNPNLTYGSVTDIDGNCYKTIQIGDETWLAENLRVTRLNDGTEIQIVTDSGEWLNLTIPAYGWPENNPEEYKDTYGALYNWYTVGTQKLCPLGWHVNSHPALNDIDNRGGKLKETGFNHWLSPNNGATNETGFTALPGVNGNVGFYWKDELDNGYWEEGVAFASRLYSDRGTTTGNFMGKNFGCSVRCVKNN
jgi:uncharacterized protein (TIGR02145 family)